MTRIAALFARHPLAISLGLAFIIRSLAAWRNYGPFAVDDYQNVIEPAMRYLVLGTKPEIPSLRFELLPYAFAYFMKPLYLIGIKRADYLVSFAYGVMGLISLTQIVAMHRIGSLLLSDRWRNAMTLFAAIWAIAPIFTNSADIAGPSYILMTFALLHLVRAVPGKFGVALQSNKTAFLLTGFFLSAAIFFRFSLAPLYFALAVWLIVVVNRDDKLTALIRFAAGGLITAVIMVLVEIANGKMPFSTALEFIRYNFGAHIQTQSYGNMPWHMYLLIFLLFPLPVLSFFFWYPMFKAARRFSGFTTLFLTFLISHSLIAFKLERYVIPVLPIMIIYLFCGLQNFADRRPVLWAYRILIALNIVMILPVALTMQQRAGVDGAINAGKLRGEVIAYKIDPWRWTYFGLKQKPPAFPDTLQELIATAGRGQMKDFSVFRFLYFTREEISTLRAAGIECTLKQVFRPDFLERVSIKLNPAMNGRRDDTAIYSCTSGQLKP
ncbi:MAG: hypothetical protein JNJ69_19150 [Leptospiraceae bacterium]|nr:hypothetical protein [Leptospiraceae bacterium]